MPLNKESKPSTHTKKKKKNRWFLYGNKYTLPQLVV